MGIMKTIAIELEELDAEVDFNNFDDLFDLVIDTQLAGVKLSPTMLQYIQHSMTESVHLMSLMGLPEFADAIEWHFDAVAA